MVSFQAKGTIVGMAGSVNGFLPYHPSPSTGARCICQQRWQQLLPRTLNGWLGLSGALTLAISL
jgi:hypothetical protein